MSEDLNDILDDILDKEAVVAKKKSGQREEEKHYPALSTISKIYQVLAWVCAVVFGAVFIAGVIVMLKKFTAGLVLMLQGGLGGIMLVIFCMAIAEGIKLFIRIEINTRKQATLLEEMMKKNEAGG